MRCKRIYRDIGGICITDVWHTCEERDTEHESIAYSMRYIYGMQVTGANGPESREDV